MADYSFTPQFANLAGLQPLPAIDVTRGGALQFQPLQAIQVASAQPELVGAGIAGAIQNIASGVLSGISARYEEKKAAEKEAIEHERALELEREKRVTEENIWANRALKQWEIENAGRPGFEKKREEIKRRLIESVPEGAVEKKEEPTPPPPTDLEAAALDIDQQTQLPSDQPKDFTTYPVEAAPIAAAAEKPLSPLPVPSPTPVEPPAAQPVLAGVPVPTVTPTPTPTPTPPPAPTPAPTPEEKKPAAVDYTEYPQPEAPSSQFETDAEALNVAAQLNNQLKGTNPDYRYEVINLGKADEWKTVVPVSIRDERIKREEAAVSAEKEKSKEERALKIEEERLGRERAKEEREAKEAEQQMQIRQQKVKDENKVLADHVETAATSLRELDNIISTIQKNPWSVGRLSGAIAVIPVASDAYKVRQKLNTIKSNIIINALNSMRQASPTGAAVGNVTEKENEMFSNTEGSIDPSLEAKDILPVLREIKRKRQKIYDDATEILKVNNPEYTPPAIEYPKETKRKSASKVTNEMVSVVSPDGKSGRIPKSQLEQAIAEGYKLKQ